MESQEKYRFITYGENLIDWFERINELANDGYRIHTSDIDQGVAALSLKTEGKYEGISNLRDVQTNEIYTLVPLEGSGDDLRAGSNPGVFELC